MVTPEYIYTHTYIHLTNKLAINIYVYIKHYTVWAYFTYGCRKTQMHTHTHTHKTINDERRKEFG